MYQNVSELAYLYARSRAEPLLLSRNAFSLCTCKFRRVNIESAMARAQMALWGNGR